MIKPSIIDGLRRYVEDHCSTGDFLRSVLENNLLDSCVKADPDNLEALKEIVLYCHWEIPWQCWGSPDRVKAWLRARPVQEKAIEVYREAV